MSATPSFPRAGVTATDIDASALGPVIIAPGRSVRIGATSDTPGATIRLSVYFLDAALQPVTVQRVSFTAPGVPDWGKLSVATPEYDPCWPMGGTKAAIVKVDQVSAGTWTIDGTFD